MASRKFCLKMNLASRIEGWLNVWDLDSHLEYRLFSDGNQPTPNWEAKYMVLLTDISSLSCHDSEESANQIRYQTYPRLRLDGGKEEFDKRWGYETLESIKENAFQHTPEGFFFVCPISLHFS
ncbi:hypothetical protein LOTGIDRAFT_158846 [Lottia gigantea]|uniref:Uncharacterized protein n=1 Tax=Lottia gigantea TaxID=225164 RepID=V4AV94_LOTGI|nr:hypothetical protein LOTGIDRAFT_158846 [Lottia gigantea]ESO98890.1 hypothetical protein LOTGIDRAFT_158846 [Lottia gigantea]